MKKKHEDNILRFSAERKIKIEKSNAKGYTLFNEGIYFYYSEKNEETLKKFLQAESEGSESADMFAVIADLYKQINNDDKSFIYYIKKALKFDRQNGLVHSLIGKYYSRKEMSEKALKHLLLAEKYDYTEMYSLILISVLYDDKPFSNYMKALEYASKTVEYFPDEPDAYYNKGIRYYHHQEYDKALKYFKKAADLGLEETDTFYFSVSYCYSMLGEPNKAVEYANKVIFLDKSNFKGYYRKGFAYFITGNDKQAIKAFLFAEKYGCRESDMYTRLAYSYTYSEAADFDKALFYANKAVELNKNEIDALFVLGCAYSKLKTDYKTALKYFGEYLKAAKISPSVEFYEQFCTSLYYCRRYKKADFYLTKALAVFPDSVILMSLKEKSSNRKRPS